MCDLNASVSWAGLSLGGKRFVVPTPLSEYAVIIGKPSKTVDPTPPAPYGYRNNQIHVFDELGLYLIEHHATALIDSVVFVLEPVESSFPIEISFAQGVRVGDVFIRPGMRESDYPSGATIVLDRQLGGIYSAEQNGIHISIRTKGRRTRSGRRTRERYLIDASVCFKNLLEGRGYRRIPDQP